MFRETITLGRPFGVRVDVSLTWLLICAAVTWSLGQLYFPARFPHWPSPLIWLAAILSSLLFLASVVAHELGHAVLATRVGIPVRSISLFMFGGVTQFKRESPAPGRELLIALVGPAVNIILGAVFLMARLVLPGMPELGVALCLWSAALNLALGVFNLLPWLPLDGGRVLRALAWYASDDRKWANRVTLIVGQLGSAALIFAGISMLITQQGGFTNAIWIMLVGWFVHSSAVASYQTSTLTTVLDGARVEDLMVRRLGRIERESAELQSPATLLQAWGPDYYVVSHEGRDVGVVAMKRLQDPTSPADAEVAESSLLNLIVPIEGDLSVDIDATAMDALRTFVERDLQWAPVLREREVVGVIRRVDLAELVEKQRGS
jgi:Zn-dependent protease